MPTSDKPRLVWFKAKMPGVTQDGSSLVSYNLACCLASAFDIDLISMELTGRERDTARRISPPFRSVTVVRPPNYGGVCRRALFRVAYEVRSFLAGVPRGALYEDCRAVRRALARAVAEQPCDLLLYEYWTSGRLVARSGDVPSVLLLHDAAHVTVQHEAGCVTSLARRRRLLRVGRSLRRFEVAAAQRATRALFLSPADEACFRELGVTTGGSISVVLPERTGTLPSLCSQDVVFIGNLAHWPNLEALRWFTREVWPHVHQAVPAARFRVVGGPVTAPVAAALARPGVELLGHVPDMASILACAALGVAPLRYGTGVKTKLLDIVWHGLPVVATPQAAPGTPAAVGGAVIADTSGEFSSAVIALLRSHSDRLRLRERSIGLLDRDHCGPAAHQSIVETFQGIAASPVGRER